MRGRDALAVDQEPRPAPPEVAEAEEDGIPPGAGHARGGNEVDEGHVREREGEDIPMENRACFCFSFAIRHFLFA